MVIKWSVLHAKEACSRAVHQMEDFACKGNMCRRAVHLFALGAVALGGLVAHYTY